MYLTLWEPIPKGTMTMTHAYNVTCTDPHGGQGVRTPTLEYHKAIGFLINTCLDPIENKTKNYQLGHHWPASVKWRFAGGLMIARF